MLDDRVEMLTAAFRAGLEELKKEMKALVDAPRLLNLEERIQEVESTVISVADSAQVAMENAAGNSGRDH